MSQNSGPNSRAGKPLNIGDSVTVIGSISSATPNTNGVITNSGPTSSIVVTLAGSGNAVTVQAQDCSASTQTL